MSSKQELKHCLKYVMSGYDADASESVVEVKYCGVLPNMSAIHCVCYINVYVYFPGRDTFAFFSLKIDLGSTDSLSGSFDFWS